MNYRIFIAKGEDFGYVSHCPAIPGCHSKGDAIKDAIENIKILLNILMKAILLLRKLKKTVLR